jgi:hypothetical protein
MRCRLSSAVDGQNFGSLLKFRSAANGLEFVHATTFADISAVLDLFYSAAEDLNHSSSVRRNCTLFAEVRMVRDFILHPQRCRDSEVSLCRRRSGKDVVTIIVKRLTQRTRCAGFIRPVGVAADPVAKCIYVIDQEAGRKGVYRHVLQAALTYFLENCSHHTC